MLPLREFLDERSPAGGRAKALLFLTHPGPSLLVTATTVGVARFAAATTPPAAILLRVGGSMLATQLAIGAANDWADVDRDRVAKPHKPLVRGVVTRFEAGMVASGGALTALVLAAGLSSPAPAAMVLGLGSGLGYDLGLKRNAASVLPWWGGLMAVPLVACAAVGRPVAHLRRLPLLAGLLAAGLHCANALPDLADDARTGVASLPVHLGPRAATAVALLAPVTAAMVACTDPGTAAARRWLRRSAAAVVTADVAAGLALLSGPGRRSMPFRLLTPAAAGLGVAWLAGVAREAPTA
ncbi:MAG: UbiA family prenyltransferase [Candidatus Dormibacteria bacterium]